MRQYDTYEVVPGVRVSGRTTLSENIADLGGLEVALDAYHASLGGEAAPVIDGLTGDQRFFLAFAQNWRAKTREAALRLVVSDNYAPSLVTIVGVTRNVDRWYAAFEMMPGDRYYLKPEDRARIW